MYAVIGTAGHVDHGKSALIQALTGSHPSHLPQEFARGMTIDLGFACLRSPQGDEIGMIDVPGHERFLRNMLCSLWGLDLLLFVVAADEGWSPLSEEHLRVIHALGIRQIVVAINKCDLADERRLDEVEEQILGRFLDYCDILPDIWRVSARTGEGIAALKQGLIDRVSRLSAADPFIPQPHLWIDRVFQVSGIGTVVTGTLRGGAVAVGDVLRLYPGNQKLKVKTIQSYHAPREQAQPCSRVALSFRHLKKEAVSRGDCLAAETAEIAVSDEWIVRLPAGWPGMKKQTELEVALGTAHVQARCYLLADGALARLQLAAPLPVFWGQTILLMAPGGSRMLGGGRVVWTGALNREQRPRLIGAVLSAPTQEKQALRCHILRRVQGYVRSLPGVAPPADACQAGDWWLTPDYRQQALSRLEAALGEAMRAIPVDELATRAQIPPTLAAALVAGEVQAGRWRQSSEGVGAVGADPGRLCPAQQQLLDEIREAGTLCYCAGKDPRPGLSQQLKALMLRRYIIPMDDKMFICRQAYENLLAELFGECAPGDLLSIADVRRATGLARKQIIPLLNRMERDGWVKRDGDLRRVRRSWQQLAQA